MKLGVDFPSIAYREGPQAVTKLAMAIESIGYDQLDMFDHVLMGYPTATRKAPIYPPQMPIMEALMTLSYAAAVTSTIGLGTEVLVLPQRHPTLVAKQISTLDTLSAGRVRLGVGVGWQESEYEALGERFSNRGARMDEAIDILRTYWRDEQIDYTGEHYALEAMAMEPKPPQGGKLPIWIGGTAPQALRRVVTHGDGWLANAIEDIGQAKDCIAEIHTQAEAADRDPATIGLQMMISAPPRSDGAGKSFYANPDDVVRRAANIQAAGFEWGSLNATAIFQAGFRSVDAMIDQLGLLHDRLRAELGN